MCSVLKGVSELWFVNTLKTRTSLTQYCVTKPLSDICCIPNASLNGVDFTKRNLSTVTEAVDRFQWTKETKGREKITLLKVLVLKVRAKNKIRRQGHILYYVLFMVLRCEKLAFTSLLGKRASRDGEKLKTQERTWKVDMEMNFKEVKEMQMFVGRGVGAHARWPLFSIKWEVNCSARRVEKE